MDKWIVEIEHRLTSVEFKIEACSKKLEEISEATKKNIQFHRERQTIEKERLKWVGFGAKYWRLIIWILLPGGSVLAHLIVKLLPHSH